MLLNNDLKGYKLSHFERISEQRKKNPSILLHRATCALDGGEEEHGGIATPTSWRLEDWAAQGFPNFIF